MSSRNLICVLFNKVPEGTHYRKGSYSWVKKPEALEYIEGGYGKEYDPIAKKVVGDEIPTKSSKKEEIINYLESNRIEFDESKTKAELLGLIEG